MDNPSINWLWYWNANSTAVVRDLSWESVTDIDEALAQRAAIAGSARCVIAMCRSRADVELADGEDVFVTPYTLWQGIRCFTLDDVQPGEPRARLRNAPDRVLYTPQSGDDFLSRGNIAEFMREALKGQSDPDKTILVLSGHGGSPSAALFSIGEVANGKDGGMTTAMSRLTVDELAAGLVEAMNNDRIGIVAFDACQDASVEMAVGLEHCAQCLIASQSNVPGVGWNYADWPAAFKTAPESRSGRQSWQEVLAERIVTSYAKNGYLSSTISAVDLDSLSRLKSALRAFSTRTINPRCEKELEVLQMARDLILRKPDAYRVNGDSDLVDVVALFGLVRSIAMQREHYEVARLAGRVMAGMRRTQLVPQYSSPDIANHHWCGLSIYFPVPGEDDTGSQMSRQAYRNPDELVRFKQATQWHKVLEKLGLLEDVPDPVAAL